MRVLGLWLDYCAWGRAATTYGPSFKALGHQVDVVDLCYVTASPTALRAINTYKYDVLWHQPHGDSMLPEVIQYARKKGIKCIHWSGDDEWLFDCKKPYSSKHLCNDYDFCVTTDPEAVEKYRKAGQKNVILSSPGFAPSIFMQRGRVPYPNDFYFCGRKTPERDKYLKALEGFNGIFDGAGYMGDHKIYLDTRTMVSRYETASIALNFSKNVSEGISYSQVKGRVFECLAMGCFVMSENAKYMKRYFKDGEHLVCFKDPADMVKKMKYYLKRPKEMNRIASLGFKRVQRYNYDKLVSEILNVAR